MRLPARSCRPRDKLIDSLPVKTGSLANVLGSKGNRASRQQRRQRSVLGFRTMVLWGLTVRTSLGYTNESAFVGLISPSLTVYFCLDVPTSDSYGKEWLKLSIDITEAMMYLSALQAFSADQTLAMELTETADRLAVPRSRQSRTNALSTRAVLVYDGSLICDEHKDGLIICDPTSSFSNVHLDV